MKRLLPILFVASLAACGQQHEPEASTDATPPPGSATAPTSSRPEAMAPAEQVGMSPATGDSNTNPTGRGEQGDSGRGQGPAPGQTGHPAPAPPAATQPVTTREAARDCERLAEPQRGECINRLQTGEEIDAARDEDRADDGGG